MDLLIDTLTLRPYVFAFMAAFVVLALHDLGRRRTVAFTASTLGVAWTAEFVSTRVGYPSGSTTTRASRGPGSSTSRICTPPRGPSLHLSLSLAVWSCYAGRGERRVAAVGPGARPAF